MAVLEILKYPHPVLKRRCEPVEKLDDGIKALIEDMRETMYRANGIGLAACQVGISSQVIVLDVSPIDPDHGFFALINPEIVSEEGDIDYEEGCLSVPDLTEKIKRKEKVSVKGVSPDGNQVEVIGEGILSIALQHEIDHLHGTLIVDRISRLKRDIYRNKVRKERQKGEGE